MGDSAAMPEQRTSTTDDPPGAVGTAPAEDSWTAGLPAESAAEIAARTTDDAYVPAFPRPQAGSPGGHRAEEPAVPVSAADDAGPAEDAVPTAVRGPTGPKVSLGVWLEPELRRRLLAAHVHTSDDEGYDSMSDYLADVLERDVERLERTYHGAVAFPGGEDEVPPDAPSYDVRARHNRGKWELEIGDVGVTLSPTLAGAGTMARTYVSLLHDVPVDAVQVRVVPELEDDVAAEITRTRADLCRAEADVERAQAVLAAAREELTQARAQRGQLTERLRGLGWPDADTDAVLALLPDDERR